MRFRFGLGLLFSLLWLVLPPAAAAQVPTGTVQSITPSQYRCGTSATAAKVKVKNTGITNRFIVSVVSTPSGWGISPSRTEELQIGTGNTANFNFSVTPPTTASEGGSIRFKLESYIDGLVLYEIGQYDISVLALPAPGTFSLVYPARNAPEVPSPVTFTWNASAAAESYTLKLYHDNGVGIVTPAFFTKTGLTSTSYDYTDLPALLAGQGYWWGVTAVNRVASTDNVEGPTTFVMQVEAPAGAFQFTSPSAINVVLAGDHPTFSWTNAANATSYNFNIYPEVNGAAGTTPVFTQNGLTVTYIQYPGTLAAGYYYALATAIKGGTTRDVDGGKRRFNVTNLGIFYLLAPSAGATRQSYQPTFTWTQSAGAGAYQLDIYEQFEDGRTQLRKSVGTAGQSYVYAGSPTLLPEKTYAWRVTAFGVNNESRQADQGLRTFTTTFVTPPIPLSPAAEETGVSRVPSFAWDTYTPSQVGQEGRWRVELAGATPQGNPDLSPPFPYVSGSLSVLYLSSPFAELSPGRDYFYRVVMSDQNNYESASSWVPFRTTDLSAFDLYGPENGETNVSVTPTLTWEPVANATAFDIYVSIVGFGPQPTRQTTTNGSFIFSADDHLNGEQLYSWAVEAKGPNGQVFSRQSFTFTTVARQSITSPDLIDHVLGLQKLGPTELMGAGVTEGQNADVATYILFKRFE